MTVLVESAPGNAPRNTPADRQRLREGAHAAKKRYPGPVGEYLAREFLAWEAFGFRFGNGGRIESLLDHLTTCPPLPASNLSA